MKKTPLPTWPRLFYAKLICFDERHGGHGALVARLISHIRPHQDDAIVCVLKIVHELVSRLIQLDVIRAGHEHHDNPAVLDLLDRTSELRSFRPQLADSQTSVQSLERRKSRHADAVSYAK